MQTFAIMIGFSLSLKKVPMTMFIIWWIFVASVNIHIIWTGHFNTKCSDINEEQVPSYFYDKTRTNDSKLWENVFVTFCWHKSVEFEHSVIQYARRKFVG